ncbi:MAG TPA: tRNA (N6-threonylcarbamoyladenosine(37)-N6)-methyltransferase TrmO [Rariglobus sp.]
MSEPISLRPVATLRTPFAGKFGVPRQSGFILEAEGRVEFSPEFAAPDFVRGLESFSHIWLVTGFHQNPPWTGAATVRPPRLGGNERVGVFASRAPNRPNGLGLSLVRLLAVESGVLRVAGVDAVDGTPVYDIKPYLPWCEARPDATSDWAAGTPFARDEAAVQIPAEVAAGLGEPTVRLLRQVLRLDLQPAYQDDPGRTYGMALAGWNILWRARPGNAVEVVGATPLPP